MKLTVHLTSGEAVESTSDDLAVADPDVVLATIEDLMRQTGPWPFVLNTETGHIAIPHTSILYIETFEVDS